MIEVILDYLKKEADKEEIKIHKEIQHNVNTYFITTSIRRKTEALQWKKKQIR